MKKLAILLLIIVFFNSKLSAETIDYDDDDLECNLPLLEGAVLTATSHLNERGPENARLNSRSAWTPTESTYNHYIQLDLGDRKKVKKIATLGRGKEMVTEYVIQFSDNGELWRTYTETSGQDQLFKGNENGDTIKNNLFDVPIIAQWIRINPTRWKDRISLRVELYGCDYNAETVYFNGSSLMSLDLLRDPISASRETIQFRFKTSHANGILMYSKGTQGDFFALQLYENRMILNINLGALAMSSFSVGSLLDDNVWHDVVISRNRRDILLSVDRVVVDGKIKGDFDKLDLNRMLYIGGVPNKEEGLVVTQNYTGCLENLYLNTTNFIREMKEAYYEGQYSRFEKVNILYNCPEPPIMPVTFLTRTSYAKLKGYEGVRTMNVSLSFRTYEDKGLIIYHEFSSKGYVKVFLEDGRVKTEIKTDDIEHHSSGDHRRGIVLDNYDEQFNDGRWHSLILTMKPNSLVLEIDQRPMRTEKLFTMITGAWYYIGGSKTKEIHNIINNRDGFIGCMRQISVDGNFKLPHDWKIESDDYCCKGEILMDACHMIDRCNPNPCKHNGVCRQNSYEFYCECGNSGYSGAVCHTSLNPLSCQAYKNIQSVSQKAFIKIDVDGSGPLDPFEVTCEFLSDGRVLTVLGHSSEHSTVVDSYQEPGSYDQTIEYHARMPQIEALLNRSRECSQKLTYSCHSARLFNSPSDEQTFRPWGWWLSRQNQMMDYWAGALPGSRKCQCGIVGNCIDKTKWCNCDANLYEWQEDGGEIKEKDYLPVRGLRFGDTGTALDEKQAKYTLGPLVCEGDDLFNNVVTFRITDATINVPRFDMGHSGDIYLEFKTTQENAVLFHAKGATDYIKLSIIAGNKLKFQYQAGSGPLGVDVETSYPLNDNNWHSVSVERNRKEARLVVDGATKSEVREPPGPVRALYLTSELAIGATLDYQDGYVGCIRALLLNGVLVDLRSYAERRDRYGRKPYGISPGCIGRCESNPCLNNGTCFERYDGFHCDCRWSSFKGPICADEIGVNLRSDSIIKYDFLGSWRSTIAENIRVGFTTTNQKGFLLGFSSNITGEYLTILVSNSGALKFVFDFGFERQEISYPGVHFGLGQYHDVRFMRKNSGSTVVVIVDNYEPKEYHFDIKDSADAQFNNVQYMYIGKNESMTDGFVGCVSRVEFDDIFPLKLLFQQNPPPNVKSLGPSLLTEDFCGVEPVTLPPVVKETRPPPIVDEAKISSYDGVSAGFLGGLLFIILLLLLIMAILIYRHMSRHKGEYLTQEDKGADDALDPDDAVVHSTTGHHVTKKKEWFI